MYVKLKDGALGSDAELLQRGSPYAVYAILLGSPIQFLVAEERAFSFPFFVPSELFDIVDSRLSKYLCYSAALPSTEAYSSRPSVLAFAEMTSDRLFYQNLVDGNEEAKRVWQQVKSLMDLEKDEEPGRS